jgi:hypothetical protein
MPHVGTGILNERAQTLLHFLTAAASADAFAEHLRGSMTVPMDAPAFLLVVGGLHLPSLASVTIVFACGASCIRMYHFYFGWCAIGPFNLFGHFSLGRSCGGDNGVCCNCAQSAPDPEWF